MPFALSDALQWKPLGAFVILAWASCAPRLPRIFSSHGFASWQVTLPITLHWIFPAPDTENDRQIAAVGAAYAAVVATSTAVATAAMVTVVMRARRAMTKKVAHLAAIRLSPFRSCLPTVSF